MKEILLYTHIVAGSITLFAGLFAMLTKKGLKNHILFGSIFYWSMMYVVVSTWALSFFRLNIFLCLVAVFAFQLIFMGRKALSYSKQIKREVYLSEKIFIAASILFGIANLGLTIYLFSKGSMLFWLPLGFTFGMLAFTRSVYLHLTKWKKKELTRAKWIEFHVVSMGGAYITSVTAFGVNTWTFLPWYLVWFIPSIIGSVIISRYVNQMRQRLNAV